MTRATDRTLIASLGFADPDRQTITHSLACQYLTRPETAQNVWRAVRPELFRHIDDKPTREGQRQWSGIVSTDTEVQIMKGTGKYATTIGFLDAVIDGGIDESEVKSEKTIDEPALYATGDGRWCQEYWSRTFRHKTFAGVVETTSEDDTPKIKPSDMNTVLLMDMTGLVFRESRQNVRLVKGPVFSEYVNVLAWNRRKQRVAIEVKTTECDVSEIARQLDLYSQYDQKLDLPTIWVAALTWKLHPESETVLTRKGIKILHLGESFDAYCKERQESKETGTAAISI